MGELQDLNPRHFIEPVVRPVITNGQEGILRVDGNGLHYSAGGQRLSFIADPGPLNFANELMSHPETPMLAGHTNHKGRYAYEVSIAKSFRGVTGALGAHAVRGHFISFGRGNSTWYGFLQNNEQPGTLIENRERFIRATETEKAVIAKRLKPFRELEDFFQDRKNPKFSKKQRAGGAAIAICVGGTFAFVTHRYHRQ